MINQKHMIDRISERADSISESVTLAIAEQAKKMKAEGLDVISLSTGEPDFPTPDVIKQFAIKAINDDFTKYTNANGIEELRIEVAKKLSLKNNIPANENDILISAGGKQAMINALLATLNTDDEVIIPTPYWTSYPEMVRLTGAKPIIVKTDIQQNFKITPEKIYNTISSKTKGIILNSPTNPTGVIYSEEELKAIAKVIEEIGIYVYSDELYEDIVFAENRHFSIGSISEIKKYAITVNGFSKAYAMTGWRLGYIHASQDVLNAASKIQSQTTSHPCSISQKAGVAALKFAGNDVELMRQSFEDRMKLALQELNKIPNIQFPIPSGAFYFFIDVSTYFSKDFPDSTSIAKYLLNNQFVAVVPGLAFGDDNCIRISYACSEEDIVKGINRIALGLQQILLKKI